MSNTSIHFLDCGKCKGAGTIKWMLTEYRRSTTLKVFKCYTCKYQYGIKELYKQITKV